MSELLAWANRQVTQLWWLKGEVFKLLADYASLMQAIAFEGAEVGRRRFPWADRE